MDKILFDYKLNPTTWAYLSSLLTIGIFFKFRRFWSVRNLDLIALILLSPGILLIYHGLIPHGATPPDPALVRFGYVWLFSVGGWFAIRLMIDPLMVRRPLLEPNLSASGLTFTGAAILVFLVANLFREPVPDAGRSVEPPLRLETVLAEQDAASAARGLNNPGLPAFHYVAGFPTSPALAPQSGAAWAYPRPSAQAAIARSLAIAGYLALVLGMVLVGYRHFDNIHTGVAAASLYLLLPYVGQMTGRSDHVIPAALLVWAVAAYRRPLLAGIFLGAAGGLIFYPFFLLPLWISFYWRRGLLRFLVGLAVALAALLTALFVLSSTWSDFFLQLQQTFGGTVLSRAGVCGFWEKAPWAYRIPILAAYVVLAASLALWPAQKNLGTLVSCSAAMMLGTQFWHGYQGGLYMAWYLPLLVLTILRPNLEDRVALSAVIEARTTLLGRLLLRRRKTAAAPA